MEDVALTAVTEAKKYELIPFTPCCQSKASELMTTSRATGKGRYHRPSQGGEQGDLLMPSFSAQALAMDTLLPRVGVPFSVPRLHRLRLRSCRCRRPVDRFGGHRTACAQ